MKKIIFYSTVVILYYLLITALVFSFSYISLINGKTYDLLWVKYIQKKLYFSGQRKIWQNDKNCSQFDVNLFYVPMIGECSFSNSEFTTKLNFDKDRRLNMIDDNIGSDEKIISILGDSVAMGWGVNDDETFSYNLQKLIEKKSYKFRCFKLWNCKRNKKIKT
ncbi:GUN4 domain-containing protein [Candidatus Pelagibacter sp.]|nr:GUN4 domain-containing protein [Candidatus Pelagibacter sp.]